MEKYRHLKSEEKEVKAHGRFNLNFLHLLLKNKGKNLTDCNPQKC